MSAYDRVFFRPRVMRPVAHVDTSTTILGVDSSVPFYISPTARNGAGNPLVSALHLPLIPVPEPDT